MFRRAACVVLFAIVGLVSHAPASGLAATPFAAFQPVGAGVFDVDGEGAAEAITATPDGKTILFTEGDGAVALGFEDISDPAHPKDAGRFLPGGYVSSTAVTADGRWILLTVRDRGPGGSFVDVLDAT